MAVVRYTLDKDIPVDHNADVIVVGGGPGGIGAAVMSARMGVKTLLVERYGCLGGMASVGEVHPFMPNHINGKPLDGPVYTDWLKSMKLYQPYEKSRDLSINKEAAMLAAEDMLLEAGVDILYHHNLVDIIPDGNAIDAVVLFSKSGFTAARAKIYVDCTGDADLAARAGCEIEQGGPSGYCQPMTLCFKLSHIRKPVSERELKEWGKKLKDIYLEARTRGEIRCPRENLLIFNWFDQDVLHFNTTRIIHKNAVNGTELSEAEMEARGQLRQILKIFRERAPGFENCRIHSVAHHIGVRETRRVRGLAYLTRESFVKAEKFPDAVARSRYGIDIHNPDGEGTEIVDLPEHQWYEIPYGCIVPGDKSNLLIGGRPISVDHAVHSSMRIMPTACSIGQAAGLAAAESVVRGCKPSYLDGRDVRRLLISKGAGLK